MASNRPAPEALFIPTGPAGPAGESAAGTAGGDDPTEYAVYAGYATQESQETWGEWNPTAETVRPVRGKHRIHKKGGGGLARSSTVLGVGVIAAVGAGGMASAQGGKPPVSLSMPDVSLPGIGSLTADDEPEAAATPADAAPLSAAGVTTADARQGTTDAGQALRARILQQAENQRHQADDAQRKQAQDAALKAATERAEAQQGKARAAAKAKAAEEKREKEEAARKKREAERLAKLAKSFTLPVSSYTLTSHFGDSGSMWSSGRHTGLDFAGSAGAPLKAVGTGTIKEAGWVPSYGYRTVLELKDGTEIWYCHQSSLGVSVGQKVSTGEVIGRMGATGNVTGVHLHLEVQAPGGGTIDPLAWLRGKGLTP
ncbi:M23 family metallopeptidase [Streptomyces sp. PmtG]